MGPRPGHTPEPTSSCRASGRGRARTRGQRARGGSDQFPEPRHVSEQRVGATSEADARGLAGPGFEAVRANVTGLRPTRQENEETFPARRKRGHSEARDPRSSTRRVAPPTEMATEEIQFDPDVHPSYVGRLVKVRESLDDPHWRHGVCCFAMTEWAMEDYHGDGKLVKVEKITGGYQLQWGLFERVEQAREQKRKQQKVRDSTPTPTSLVVAAPIRIARDSSFPDARPLPSPRSSRARTTPSTWTS